MFPKPKRFLTLADYNEKHYRGEGVEPLLYTYLQAQQPLPVLPPIVIPFPAAAPVAQDPPKNKAKRGRPPASSQSADAASVDSEDPVVDIIRQQFVMNLEPYPCQRCTRKFAKYAELKKHCNKMHRGRVPDLPPKLPTLHNTPPEGGSWQCQVCKEPAGTTRGNYLRHLERVHKLDKTLFSKDNL